MTDPTKLPPDVLARALEQHRARRVAEGVTSAHEIEQAVGTWLVHADDGPGLGAVEAGRVINAHPLCLNDASGNPAVIGALMLVAHDPETFAFWRRST